MYKQQNAKVSRKHKQNEMVKAQHIFDIYYNWK